MNFNGYPTIVLVIADPIHRVRASFKLVKMVSAKPNPFPFESGWRTAGYSVPGRMVERYDKFTVVHSVSKRIVRDDLIIMVSAKPLTVQLESGDFVTKDWITISVHIKVDDVFAVVITHWHLSQIHNGRS